MDNTVVLLSVGLVCLTAIAIVFRVLAHRERLAALAHQAEQDRQEAVAGQAYVQQLNRGLER